MAKLSREDLMVYLIFATVGFTIPAVIALRHFVDIDPLAWLHIKWGRSAVGIVFTLLATVVCLLNFYLSILTPWLDRRQQGSVVNYAHISGLPIVGGIFVFCGGALIPSSVSLGIFLLFLYVIDGNGIPRFFFSMVQKGLYQRKNT